MARGWMTWAVWLASLLNVLVVEGQVLAPANATDNPAPNVEAQLALLRSQNDRSQPVEVFTLIGLTSSAIQDIPPNGRSGTLLLANASSELSIASDNIALISCDPEIYNGMINASQVLTTAEQADHNATAVVLYSLKSDSCSLSGDSSGYSWVYTLNSLDDTKLLLSTLASHAQAEYAAIVPSSTYPESSSVSGSSSSTTSNSQNALGPSPSTAVAMIILYSITGVITALFLIIIFTGAVRAHRHPERYGPRNGIGRPRQSRARGIARAMLETIPIVKFGDGPAEQQPKPTDVELAEAGHGSVEVLPDQAAGQTQSDEHGHAATASSAAEATRSSQTDNNEHEHEHEHGIAPAVVSEQSKTPQESQGCSICTEDFEVGQDQRVLPCDHRFHPDCIDPWLLNVSGTCPLCRVDLRPSTADTDVDEHGNPTPPDGDSSGLAPPLEQDSTRRLGVRRSIMAGFSSIRPERMTRDERLDALRQLREQQQQEEQQQQRQPSSTTEAPAEEESRTRRRLRNAFRVRTRRTGADGQVQDVSEQ